MRKTFVMVIALTLITINTAFAGKINPDLDLSEFWSYGASSQNESIGIFIYGISNMVYGSKGSFSSSYTSKTSNERISSMKSCMKSNGVSYDSIGQAYLLCIRRLGWIRGVN